MVNITHVSDMCSGCFRSIPEKDMIPIINIARIEPVFYCKDCYKKEIKK